MERRMSSMTQMEIAKIIGEHESRSYCRPERPKRTARTCRPTPTRIRSNISRSELSARIDAVVAPPVAYGISKTFEFFPGTISLSIPTYQTMVFEIGAALIKQGFHHLIILNGNRPSGTANDARLPGIWLTSSTRSSTSLFRLSAIGSRRRIEIHAMRKSVPAEWATVANSKRRFQLATRPELVKMAELAAAKYGPVGWDLVAPSNPTRTYMRRPRPAAGHAAIFGDPTKATAEAGNAFIDAAVDGLVETFKNLQGSYQERR